MQSDKICRYLPQSLAAEISEAKRQIRGNKGSTLLDGLPKSREVESDFELNDDEICQQIECVRDEFEKHIESTDSAA